MVYTRSGLTYGEIDGARCLSPSPDSNCVSGTGSSSVSALTCETRTDKALALEVAESPQQQTFSRPTLQDGSSFDESNNIISDSDILYFHDNLKLTVSERRQLYFSAHKKAKDFFFKLCFQDSVKKSVAFTNSHMLELISKLDKIEAALDLAIQGKLLQTDNFKYHLGDGLIVDVSTQTGLGLRYWMLSLNGNFHPMSGLHNGININLFDGKEFLTLIRKLLVLFPVLCQESPCSLSHCENGLDIIACTFCCYSLLI